MSKPQHIEKADVEDPAAPAPSQGDLQVEDGQSHVHDAVFGEITEEGPNYRNVGWLGTTVVMLKTMIGIGALGIPLSFDTLGMVPGVICLCAIATIITWSDYVIGTFKRRHPSVYSIDDACGMMFGRFARELSGVIFCIYWIFVSGSSILALSISLNAMSTHGACTAVFAACCAILGFILASIRTIGQISWVAWLGVICIVASLITVTVAVGLQDRPPSAPQVGPWSSDYKITNNPSFAEAASAVSTIVFAYTGTPAFFGIAHEMRDPRLYTRSMLLCQTVVTAVYISVACVIYYYAGSYVASPALGTAGAIMKKICYGIAFPGLAASTTIVSHLPAKFVFVRLLRNSRHLTSNTITHWVTWLSCTFSVLLIAYIIASAIPVFGGLVSLAGALLGTVLSIQPMGCMWLYDNWSEGKVNKSPSWIFMVCWSVFVILAGTFLTVAGTYGSIVSIYTSYHANGGSSAFSCADNSNSV